MHPITTLLPTVLLGALALPLAAQEAVPPYEGYPILKASELLQPAILKGPYHEVLDPVPTRGFANQYSLQTNWGHLTVHGNRLLVKRIAEFDAIARLENASKSDEFNRSLRSAAATPLIAVGGALQDPGAAVQSIGQGAARLFQRAGEAIERGGKKSAHTDSALEGALGFSKAKRKVAGDLGVDPYSENQILQQRLDEMARASFAGGFVINAGTFALSAGANVGVASVARTASMGASISKAVYDNSPLDLSNMNRDQLVKLGVNDLRADSFVEQPHISPSQQTSLTASLSALGPVAGIEDFIVMSLATRDTAEAQYFVDCAAMMAAYHTRVSPIKRVLNLYGLPAIHANNNALVLPLAVDYVSWSPESDRLSQTIAAYKPAVEISSRVLYLAGRITPLCRQQLEARGFVVAEGADAALYRE